MPSSPSDPSRANARMPLILAACVACLGISLTVALWWLLEEHDREIGRRQVDLVAEQSAQRLSDYVAGRVLSLQLVVDHVRATDEVEEGPFAHVADQVQTHFTGFQAINWIDEEGLLKWLRPLAGNEPAQHRIIYDHQDAHAFARHAADTGVPTATGPIDLFQGGRGFATYLPVYDDTGLRGMVNGVFRNQALIEDCFSDSLLTDYALEVTDTDGVVFASPGFHDLSERAVGEGRMRVLDREWTLRLAPRDVVWRTVRPGNVLVLPLGLSGTLGLSLLAFAWGRGQEQRRVAALERADLEAELQRARRLETIGRLAGGVAHDFNNLLTVVSAHAELARSFGDVRAQEHLDAIDAASERAAALTRQLLAYGGPGPHPRGVVDVDIHLQDLTGLLRRLVRDDVQLTLRAEADGACAGLHPEQLGQIVLNLVVNAADAMPEGGRVEIWSRAHAGAGEVEIGVRDEGTGIDETVRERIFHPFVTTKGEGGTGMGLPTVRARVDEAGGRIELSTVAGGGTTFQVWLPMALGEAPSEAASPLRRHERPRREGWRVLLVDDDELVRNAVQCGLERAGFEVVTAAHGQEALDHVLSDAPDPHVVVSDQVMPVMGGLALAQALWEHRPDLPIILSTGYAGGGAQDREALRERGVQFLQKPFHVHELARLCSRLVRRTPP